MGSMITHTAEVKRIAEQRIMGLSWVNWASASAYHRGEVAKWSRNNLSSIDGCYEAMRMFDVGNYLSGDRKPHQRTRLLLRKMTEGVSGDEEDIFRKECVRSAQAD